jgi:hypothetical protein
MRWSIVSVAAVLAAVVTSSPAAAESLVVKSGVETPLAWLGIYNMTTCTTMPLPVVNVIEQPKHGTLTVGRANRVIRSNNLCDGREISVMVALYRSRAGFHGADRAVFDVSRERSTLGIHRREDRYTIDIDVK